MSGKHYMRIGKRRIPLPGSAGLRIAIGILLILGGFVGFLPILGFWMVPVGVVVLSVDLPIARRLRRKIEVWWGKRKQRKAAEQPKEK